MKNIFRKYNKSFIVRQKTKKEKESQELPVLSSIAHLFDHLCNRTRPMPKKGHEEIRHQTVVV